MRLTIRLGALILAWALALPSAHAEEQAVPVEQVFALDPALVEKARPIAELILPDGTFAEMMGPMMQKMMGPMMDSISKMPLKDLAEAGGVDPTEIDKMGPATLEQVMAIVDPAFRQRLDIMTQTMFPALVRFMSQFEPDMREGMAEAFAGRYNAAELNDINAFLKTPTGAKFGSGFMMLGTDPHYMNRMQIIMPKMVEAMPSLMQESSAALEKLPKARKYKELSKAERTRLAEILGIDPKKMKP